MITSRENRSAKTLPFLKIEASTMSPKIHLDIEKVQKNIKLQGGPSTLEEAFFHSSFNGFNEHDLQVDHIWAIVSVAAQCETAVEFGVRRGVTTLGITFGLAHSEKKNPSLTSYDIELIGLDQHGLNWPGFIEAARERGVDCKFILGNSRKVSIPETDLLFIDSYHSYSHFMEEIRLHLHKAKKYIIMHDSSATGTFGLIDQKEGYDQTHDYKNYEKEGMHNAAMDFAELHGDEWEIFYHDDTGEGLTIFVTKNKEMRSKEFFYDTTPYSLTKAGRDPREGIIDNGEKNSN